ncbi:MAG: sigma-70 family RNA polymerase sigma factor [Solirubrobacterales bacterium]|nr:sigma-70 family RNA polymerase sigma factor [Solirubrobacterales bacterium]
MEASAVPRAAPAGVSGVFQSPHLLRLASDARLVTLVRERNAGAFEAVYNRHHRAILSFCRHMLGDAQEAEDALQHTFLAAYNDLVGSKKQIHLRAWLFKIARNRCYSMLRSRREEPANDLDDQVTEGLATQVQRRQDLRDLVGDVQRLPEDQRAALVLAEVDALSHEEVAAALGVPREKVKALVFQARESLLASRAARETDCAEIREQLATQRGGALRRGNLRRHLRECPGCRAFRRDVERQRHQLALVLPVVPTLALKQAVLGGGASASLGLGGAALSTALKSGLLKGLATVLLAGVGTAGTVVATQTLLSPPTITGTRLPRQAESLGRSDGAPATTGVSALDSIGTPERIPKTLPWVGSPSVAAATTESAAPGTPASTVSIDPLSLLRAFAPITTTATVLVGSSQRSTPAIVGSAPFATAPPAEIAPAGGAAPPPGESEQLGGVPAPASANGQTPATPPVPAAPYSGSSSFHGGQGAGASNRGQGLDGGGGGSHGYGPGAVGGTTRGAGPGRGFGAGGGLGERGSGPGGNGFGAGGNGAGGNGSSASGNGFGTNGNGSGVGGGAGSDGSGSGPSSIGAPGTGSGSAAGGLGRGSGSGSGSPGGNGGSSSSESGSGSQAPTDSGASSGGTGHSAGGPGSGGGLAGSEAPPSGSGAGSGSGSGSGRGTSGASDVSGSVRPAVAAGVTGTTS